MAERRVLFRDGKNPLFVSGFRDSKTHLRGYVENGAYNILFKKAVVEGMLWSVHETTALTQCNEHNQLGWCDPKTLVIIDVPDTVQGDHHVIVNWAERRIANAEGS